MKYFMKSKNKKKLRKELNISENAYVIGSFKEIQKIKKTLNLQN